jgi:alpha-glucosidase (family GH31 glycosyl hydrolase)
MQNKLAAKGRRMVTIIDPHIERDGNYYINKVHKSYMCIHVIYMKIPEACMPTWILWVA